MSKQANSSKECRATYIVVTEWFDYEPCISLFDSKKEASKCYAESVKAKKFEPLLAKILKGTATFRKG